MAWIRKRAVPHAGVEHGVGGLGAGKLDGCDDGGFRGEELADPVVLLGPSGERLEDRTDQVDAAG